MDDSLQRGTSRAEAFRSSPLPVRSWPKKSGRPRRHLSSCWYSSPDPLWEPEHWCEARAKGALQEAIDAGDEARLQEAGPLRQG